MEFSGSPQKRSFCGAWCRNGVSAETPAIRRGGKTEDEVRRLAPPCDALWRQTILKGERQMFRSLHMKLVLVLVLLIVSVMAVVGTFLINSVISYHIQEFESQMA